MVDNVKVYEARWSHYVDAAQAEIAAGERELARLVNGVDRRTRVDKNTSSALSTLMGADGSGPGVMQRISRRYIVETVLEHCEGAELIIEIGAGWGPNLFELWMAGGPDVDYECHELTETGCQACDLIAGAAVLGPRIKSVRCDFRELRLAPRGLDRVVVFTAHAADKVGELVPDFIDQLAGLGREVCVLHFESVLYQLQDDPEGMAHAERFDKNRNLMPMLRAAEAEGRIKIEEIRPVTLGGLSSLIRWRAERPA